MAREIKEIKEEVKNLPNKAEDFYIYLKDNYKNRKNQIYDFSDKSKHKIRENPYESLAIGAGIGTIIGISIGTGITAEIARRNNENKFKKKLIKTGMTIKQNPLQSIGIGLSLTLLATAVIKSVKNKQKYQE